MIAAATSAMTRSFAAALAGLVLASTAAWADSATPSHGISVFGDLKYGPGFKHFGYVNPDAPKGGTIKVWGLDTFETLNPFILKGRKEAWNALIFDTLMTRAADEPDALYALVANGAAIAADHGSVAFTIDPRARFHDGTRITAEDVVFTFETLVKKGHPSFRINFRDVAKAEALGPRAVRFVFKPGFHRDLPTMLAGLPVLSKAYYATAPFAKTTFVAPVLDRFILVKGRPEASEFVEHVTFEGLTFRHARHVTPPSGFEPNQAAASIDAVVMLDGARHVAIRDCEFAHVGRYGVWFRRGCRDCTLERSLIDDLGAGGVRIGETRDTTPAPGSYDAEVEAVADKRINDIRKQVEDGAAALNLSIRTGGIFGPLEAPKP